MALTKINNNTLSAITGLPAGVGGKVLQVVTATDSTGRSTTSTSFVTGSNTMSVNITPSSTSSKIYINVTGNIYQATAAKYAVATIKRGSTDLGAANNKGLTNIYTSSSGDGGDSLSLSVLDSPSSTSQITYQVVLELKDKLYLFDIV